MRAIYSKSGKEEFVAMKKLNREAKEGFPVTALREIRILSRIKHGNIVRLIETVTSKRTSTKLSHSSNRSQHAPGERLYDL